jgi:hypothetical protein
MWNSKKLKKSGFLKERLDLETKNLAPPSQGQCKILDRVILKWALSKLLSNVMFK